MIGKTMTAPRRQRKLRCLGLAAALIAAGVVIGGLVQPGMIRAATTEYLVVDRNSGLAISGFDPVAYFIDGVASLGKGDFEASFAGAVWRFRNEGNRASFVAHPEIYGPQFGGYDPVDLGRGVTYAGNPRFWVVTGQRLYLFGREENRDAFAADPSRFLKDASARWPMLEQNLAR
jgi:YHS domain-containing protein